MSWQQDWDAIAQERIREWEAEICKRQLLAHLPRQRPRWRRWTAGGLMRVGGWLIRWGEQMEEYDCGPGVAVAGPVVENSA